MCCTLALGVWLLTLCAVLCCAALRCTVLCCYTPGSITWPATTQAADTLCCAVLPCAVLWQYYVARNNPGCQIGFLGKLAADQEWGGWGEVWGAERGEVWGAEWEAAAGR